MNTSFSALAAWWRRLICRMRDIGFVHASMALAAAAGMPSRCR